MSPEELRARLAALGMQMKEFALLLGVAQSTPSRWGTEGYVPVPRWVVVLLDLMDEHRGARLPMGDLDLLVSNQIALMNATAAMLADGTTHEDRQTWVETLRIASQRSLKHLAHKMAPIP